MIPNHLTNPYWCFFAQNEPSILKEGDQIEPLATLMPRTMKETGPLAARPSQLALALDNTWSKTGTKWLIRSNEHRKQSELYKQVTARDKSTDTAYTHQQ